MTVLSHDFEARQKARQRVRGHGVQILRPFNPAQNPHPCANAPGRFLSLISPHSSKVSNLSIIVIVRAFAQGFVDFGYTVIPRRHETWVFTPRFGTCQSLDCIWVGGNTENCFWKSWWIHHAWWIDHLATDVYLNFRPAFILISNHNFSKILEII